MFTMAMIIDDDDDNNDNDDSNCYDDCTCPTGTISTANN
jgi:hypothetical protein